MGGLAWGWEGAPWQGQEDRVWVEWKDYCWVCKVKEMTRAGWEKERMTEEMMADWVTCCFRLSASSMLPRTEEYLPAVGCRPQVSC